MRQSVIFIASRLGAIARSTWAELLLVVVLFVLALTIRLPNLMLIPRYTDEGQEVLWALNIARGNALPLTAVDPYDGPIFAYMVAGLLRVFGTSTEIPRLMVAVIGALTVPATYWVGQLMWNRGAGLTGAALTLVSPLLVVFSSHHGWSSALVPFFAIMTLGTLYAGVVKQQSGLFGLSGLMAAFTLQTHPTSGVALIGMLIWFLSREDARQWLKRPAPYVALGLFLLGYAPMIVANLRLDSPLPSVLVQRDYAFVPTLNPLEYVQRMIVLLRVGGFYVGGGIGTGTLPLRLTAMVMEILLFASLVLAWRRDTRLIPIAFITTIILLPFFVVSDSYRYYVYLIPMAYIVVGIFAVRALSYLWDTRSKIARAPLLHRVAQVAAGLFILTYVAYPVVTISDYYRDATANGQTNEGYFRIENILRTNGACDSVFVEQPPPVPAQSPYMATVFALNTMDYVLTLDNCAHSTLTSPAIQQRLAETGKESWLIIPPESKEVFSSQFDLALIADFSAPEFESSFAPIGLYLVLPRR